MKKANCMLKLIKLMEKYKFTYFELQEEVEVFTYTCV